eukprot:13403334-Ditylum_brightwellii.AAC.2
MFNRMSRRKCREYIRHRFPHLLPLFDSLYKRSTKVHVVREDGTHQYIIQGEGFAQGCPLSSVFATLVLGELLKELRTSHLQRITTAHRPPSSYAEALCYIDDGNIILDHADVLWFLEELEAVGSSVGAKINRSKTKIFTSTSGTSILPYITCPQARASLTTAIGNYTSGETTDGVVILGVPIGSREFIANALEQFTQDFTEDTTKIMEEMEDAQTALQMYNQCILSRVPFRMIADVICNHDERGNLPADDWHSTTSDAVDSTTKA